MAPSRICYFNFDDECIKPYPSDIVSQVLEVFFELSPEIRLEGAYIFFDETQDVPGWELAARRIVDTEKVTMYLTGSSSRLLSEDIATSFRGRSVAYELSSYSFAEFLRVNGQAVPSHAGLDSKATASTLKKSFREYLLEGGFPAVIGLDKAERVQVRYDMADEKTRRREIGALEEALGLFPGARATVVTLDEHGSQATSTGEARIVPAWRWVLERGDCFRMKSGGEFQEVFARVSFADDSRRGGGCPVPVQRLGVCVELGRCV